jgi:hypothetical protein
MGRSFQTIRKLLGKLALIFILLNHTIPRKEVLMKIPIGLFDNTSQKVLLLNPLQINRYNMFNTS